MKRKLEKAIALMLMVCIVLGCIPVAEVKAASTNQVNVSETITPTVIWEDETIDVLIDLESIPYEGKVEPNDIIMVLDCSGSMISPEDKLSKLKVAAKEFVQKIDISAHRIGIVAYGTNVDSVPITDDKQKLIDFIDNLSTLGSTNTSLAINKAVDLLSTKRGNAIGSIILMTDGEADNQNAAIVSSESAKNKKYVFYTIALCKESNSIENTNLKKMATSEADHYSVFATSKLTRAYASICNKIGKMYAKDVVVTQTIAEPFELVSGSTDSNVPQPTISGNTLTWKMNQLGQGHTYLTYKLKVKNGAIAGTYKPVTGTVSYRDYNNGMNNIMTQVYEVKLRVHSPKIMSSSPDTCTNGNADEVTLDVKYLQNGAKVYVDGKMIANPTMTNDAIKFNMPNCTPGNVTIEVVNPDGQSSSTVMKVKGQSGITNITPSSGKPKTRTEITITGVDILTAFDTKKTVKVLIGSKTAMVLSVDTKTQTIVCKTPSLAVGTYDVEVINKDNVSTTKAQGFKYEDTVPVITNPVITSISPAVGKIKTRCQLVIEGDLFDIVSYPTITLKAQSTGKIYSVTIDKQNSTSTHIECKTSSLPLDKYDVILTNPDGGTATKVNGFETTDGINRQNPVIDSVTPNVVPPKTRTIVVIKGSNFVGTEKTIKVLINGYTAMITSVSDSQIEIKVPSLAVGSYDIQVINSTGASCTLANAIEYRNP